MERMGELLALRQLGCGVKGGAEAALHAAWLYLQDLDPLKVVVKLDFRNTFNAIYRDKMLLSVMEHSPELYPFCIFPPILHLHLLE